MVLKKEQERIKTLLKDTITLLCKNGLTFKNEFSLEALIGITLDKDEVMLVSINEIVQSELSASKHLAESAEEAGDESAQFESEGNNARYSVTSSNSRRKRRRSKNSMREDTFTEGSADENSSLHSESEPPNKKQNPVVKTEDSDDLVFVKQEIDTGSWPSTSQGHEEEGQGQDSFQTSYSGASQQDAVDFLQGASLEPVAGHSGDMSLQRHHRKMSHNPGDMGQGDPGPQSQMGQPRPPLLQMTGVRPEKLPQVEPDEELEPLMLTSKASTQTSARLASLSVGQTSTTRQQPPSIAHNFVVLSPSLRGPIVQPLALMSPPFGLPVAHNLSMVSPASKNQITATNISVSIPPLTLRRGVADLTVTSPSIRGPRLASDLPLSSPIVSYGNVSKARRSSACSSTSSMEPPKASPGTEKPKQIKPVRRSSVDTVVTKLNDRQEQEIVVFINNMTKLGFKVTVNEVCDMAHEMIYPKKYKNTRIKYASAFGNDWWKNFLIRHPEVEENDGQVLPCSAPKSV